MKSFGARWDVNKKIELWGKLKANGDMDEEFTFSDLENGIQIKFLFMMSFVVGMPCLRWFPWKLSNIYDTKMINFLNHNPNCYRTQITGITVISDASGFGFKQARHFTLDIARAGTAFVQVSLWTILKGIDTY